jgi:hypothetical protein
MNTKPGNYIDEVCSLLSTSDPSFDSSGSDMRIETTASAAAPMSMMLRGKKQSALPSTMHIRISGNNICSLYDLTITTATA